MIISIICFKKRPLKKFLILTVKLQILSKINMQPVPIVLVERNFHLKYLKAIRKALIKIFQ